MTDPRIRVLEREVERLQAQCTALQHALISYMKRTHQFEKSATFAKKYIKGSVQEARYYNGKAMYEQITDEVNDWHRFLPKKDTYL